MLEVDVINVLHKVNYMIFIYWIITSMIIGITVSKYTFSVKRDITRE